MTQQANIPANPIDVYEIATRQARSVITGVKPEQMKKPTPCVEWDVAALVRHMINAQANSAGTISGGQVPPGKTPLESFDAAVSIMLKAVKSPAGLEKKVQGRQGEVPAAQVLGGACMDLTVHTWDLATATGQDTKLALEVVEFIFPIVEGIAKRGSSKAFSAPIDVQAHASQQDKMIAMTGRKP